MYWTNYGAGTIGRASLDGTHVTQRLVTGAHFPIGLAVDGRHVYWTTYDGIGRANLDGSGINDDFISADSPVGLTVDGEHVYWTSRIRDRIGRAKLDGSGVDERFVTDANRPTGVAVDGQHVYWSNSGDDTIGRANLDGSHVNHRCIAIRNVPIGNVPEGLAADDRYVYWTNYPANTIGRANPDGTGVDAHFITVKGVPEGIAVDSNRHAQSRTKRQGRCAPSRAQIVLGSKHYQREGYPAGWGEAAPVTISNGGVAANGTISRIHWRTWGSKVAVGRGLHPIYRPRGGYYPRPVVIQLRASVIRRCTPGGPLTYTRLTFREPSKPGGPIGPWQTWTPNMCPLTHTAPLTHPPRLRSEGVHGTGIVATEAFPYRQTLSPMLSPSAENNVIADIDVRFAVTIQNTGRARERSVKVTLKIDQPRSPLAQTKTIREIGPGEQKTVTFRNLGVVTYETRTTVRVAISPVPGEPNLSNNRAAYPVIFTLD